MSNRSMLEFNHDYTPHTEQEKIDFIKRLCRYLTSGDPKYLPDGVTFFGMRHHTEKCPLGDPPNGWGNSLNKKTHKEQLMDKIKCGRVTYDLKSGDTILDNGACLQLISRKIRKGRSVFSPSVSKAEFKKFIKLTNIKITTEGILTYYQYHKE